VTKKNNWLARRKTDDSEIVQSPDRVTNANVSDERKNVLKRARRYMYPLQHSKHRVVALSITILVVVIMAFFSYSVLALYGFQSVSSFTHGITKILPFPVARIGANFVPYEHYLFEVRHRIHYYETQEQTDFGDETNQEQLNEFRRQSLAKVIDDAYIARAAREKGITVSNEEVDAQIEVLRAQGRLGGDDRFLEDVLKDFWGWTMDDLRRSLRLTMLSQKVVAELDIETQERAQTALDRVRGDDDFADVAKEVSEDRATAERGGEFPALVDRADKNYLPVTTETLFNLEEGEVSEIMNIGYGLEILKSIERQGERVRGAHILFNFKDAEEFLNDYKDESPARVYISVSDPVTIDQLETTEPVQPEN
jgi:hypothetical protein